MDAAVGAEAWDGTLDRLAERFGADTALLVPSRPEDVEAGMPVGARAADLVAAYVETGWHRTDLRCARAFPKFAAGRMILVDHDLASDAERERLPFFRDFVSRQDLAWWGGLGFVSGDRLWSLSLLRRKGRGPFGRDEITHLGALAGDIARAVALAERFRRSVEARLLDSAELTGAAVVSLAAGGRVTGATSAAAALVGGALRLKAGHLSAADAGSDQRLQAAIRAATAAGDRGAEAPLFVVVERQDGRPLLVEAIPLPRSARDAFSRNAALLVLTDLGADATPAPETLAACFGLTPAEAAIAGRIAAGEDLRGVAEEQGISYQTARVHLRNIFAKMGVARQSELAATIRRLPAATGEKKPAPGAARALSRGQ